MATYSVDETVVEFDDNGFAKSSGFALAYNTNLSTREYLRAEREWVSEGTTLAAGSYHDAPDISNLGENQAIVRNTLGTAWEYVSDHRGKTIYLKENGTPSVMSVLGDIPDTYTTVIPPEGRYIKFIDGAWVTDTDKATADAVNVATAKYEYSLEAADANIAHISEAVVAGDATDSESSSLDGWKTYRRELNRLNLSLGEGVVWPALNVTFTLPKYPLNTISHS